MSPIRIILAASLAAAGFSRAEDVATETTPLAPDLTETLLSPPAGDSPSAPAAAAPSPNVTVNLINRLVEKGILARIEADEMIKQAETDAVAAQQAAAAQADIAALPPAPSEDEMRVTYIPEVVRNNMRDQIKQELMAAAREEKWSDKQYPQWVDRFRPFGDIRGRYEGVYFSGANDNGGAFPNFNAINTGAPFDTAGAQFSPQHNVDQDRERARLRVRFGTDIMLGDSFNGGIRLATGESNSPTSPNQTLGANGGNFSKYAIWLDRAFLSYDAGPGDGEELLFLLGRFDNPFFTASEINWDDDLGFDGLAVRGKVRLNDCATTFFTAGYFPVYNTDFNFASNQPAKFESTDKWLAGAQLGIDWKIKDDLTAKIGIAYYDFNAIEGDLSSPFTPLSASDAGDTDTTRPGFAQRGNTYMALRDIVPTAANDFGAKNQFQYYGLASEFRNITATGRLDWDHFEPVRISLLGEATKNIGFDKSAVASRAVNNGGKSGFDGGDTAWTVGLQVGKPALESFGDWQAAFGYRYVESDAVVDGFTDSDFGGGGTNVQGFTIGGTMAVSPAVRLGLRWMSSDEIAGSPLASDTLQFDINAKF